MAGASLLTLIDDIATVLDDVAVLSKIAVKKTAGVLGDDLALNAEQVAGVRAEREIPVVKAVAIGSLKNKFILVPAALLISAVAPWLITPFLMLGGAYLCYEGAEKVWHALTYSKDKQNAEKIIEARFEDQSNVEVDLKTLENKKIKGAVKTDFILSAEIIVIALGSVQQESLTTQILVVSLVAVMITFVVYGLVGLIVKIDDVGLYLLKKQGQGICLTMQKNMGNALLSFAPKLMKSLTYIGTLAMFLVGGGIILHGIPSLAPIAHSLESLAQRIPEIGGTVVLLVPPLLGASIGIVLGVILVTIHFAISKLRKPLTV